MERKGIKPNSSVAPTTVRQQNAERRLRHAKWENRSTSNYVLWLIGIVVAIYSIITLIP